VAVTKTGVISFRFDYEFNRRRETLVIGRYDAGIGARNTRALEKLDFGMSLSLSVDADRKLSHL
jgi:hypothetical protein